MDKKKYMQPKAETVRLNLSEAMMDDGFPIVISGGTTPEESDSKQMNNWEEDNEWPKYNLWDE